MRRALLVTAALVVSVCAGSAGRGAAAPSCRTPEVQTHDEAVFGHFAVRSQAVALARRARAVKFEGIKIEDDGCGDFEVEIDGADTSSDRTSFAAEAAKAGFQVTFEQTAPPLAAASGQVVGVFAQGRSLARLNALAGRVAAVGFRYVDIARDARGTWLLVMPQVPIKHALSIAAEVHRAGFRIAFEPGSKTG